MSQMDRHPRLQRGSTALLVQGTEGHDSSPSDSKSTWAKLTETWTFEFGGFVAALACLAATVALLSHYNNKPNPEWPVITLNFLLSLLGNAAFASTLFGVHASIAQSKWIWFVKRPRPMADLAAFQNARGGLVGAVQLPFAVGAHIAIIATSLAVVMGTLWGPFTQNLIRYEPGNITADGRTALLSRSVEYRGRGISKDSDAYHVDPFLEFDIMSALMTAPNEEVNHPKFFCSTGNCTWDPVATLGFCSRCTDLTPQIELACAAYNLTSYSAPGVGHKCTAVLPAGSAGLYYIDTDGPATETLMNITQVGGMDGLRYHAIRMLPPYSIDPSPRPLVTLANFSATECSLSLCVLRLNASVSSGLYSETVIDTFTEPPPPGTHWMRQKLRPPWGPENGINPAANLSFGLMESLWPDWGYGNFLVGNSTIPGWAKTRDDHKGIVFCAQGPDPNCTDDLMPGMIFSANYTPSACGSPNADTFACAMRGVAAALTKTLRNAGVTANGTGIGDQFLVQGRAETTVPFVRVRWGWIALPCAVWVLGLVAWAMVASQTRRMGLPAWRDDPLPLAFLYREEGGGRPGERQLRDGLLAADDCSSWAYEKVAEGMNVQLLEVPCQRAGGGSGVKRLVLTEQGG